VWCQACNRDVVEKALCGCILHSKMLTPHQCCQLVMFMVDHVKLLFDVPSDVARIVHDRLHSPLSAGENSKLTFHLCVISECLQMCVHCLFVFVPAAA